MGTICNKKTHLDVQEFRKETVLISDLGYAGEMNRLTAECAEKFRGVLRGTFKLGLRRCEEESLL
jgi:hypothetical protein